MTDVQQEMEAALAEPVQEPVGNSYADLFNALQRIETAAVFLPSFKITHEGGLEAVVQNIVNAIAALAEPVQEPVQRKEHCLWARNGNEPCPHVQRAEPVQELPWLRAIDEAMVDHHVGVADVTDDYETAKRKLNTLLCHAQDIGAHFAKQAEPVQEPVAWGSGDGYWIRAEDKAIRPDRERFTVAFYTSPPQRKPLTEEEIEVLAKKHNGIFYDCDIHFARAIEAAHGIKEGT